MHYYCIVRKFTVFSLLRPEPLLVNYFLTADIISEKGLISVGNMVKNKKKQIIQSFEKLLKTFKSELALNLSRNNDWSLNHNNKYFKLCTVKIFIF